MVNMALVWDRTSRFVGDNRSSIVPVAMLALFVPSAVQGSLRPLAATGGATAVLVGLASVALSLVTLWGQLFIMALAIDPAGGRGAAVTTATNRFLPAVGVALVLLFGAMMLACPLPIGLALSGVDLQAAMRGGVSAPSSGAALPIGAAVFVAIYGLALAALALWLAARLVVTNAVVVAERRAIGAIPRAFTLTRGLALKIVGVVLLYGIVLFVATSAAKFVFGSIFQLLLGGDASVTVATVLTATVVAAIGAIFSVLASGFIAKLYLSIRDAREAVVERL